MPLLLVYWFAYINIILVSKYRCIRFDIEQLSLAMTVVKACLLSWRELLATAGKLGSKYISYTVSHKISYCIWLRISPKSGSCAQRGAFQTFSLHFR